MQINEPRNNKKNWKIKNSKSRSQMHLLRSAKTIKKSSKTSRGPRKLSSHRASHPIAHKFSKKTCSESVAVVMNFSNTDGISWVSTISKSVIFLLHTSILSCVHLKEEKLKWCEALCSRTHRTALSTALIYYISCKQCILWYNMGKKCFHKF